MAQLQEKILLVTGASQGIGEQVAKAYAAAGATVVLVARHQKKLEKVYDEIVAAGGPEPFAICFDLLSRPPFVHRKHALSDINAADSRNGLA